MAKKAVEIVEVDKRETLLALLKARTPGIFEREPAQAFAEGNLQKLVDDILAL